MPSPTRVARLPRRATLLIGLLLAAPSLVVGAAALAGGFQSNRAPGQTSQTQKKQAPTYAVPAARMPVEGDEFEMMTAELNNAEMRVKEAMQNVVTAEANLTRARTRRYPRGAALEEIRTNVTDTQKERDMAQKDFLALVDKARRTGVPNGTMMRFMDLADLVRKDQQARAATSR